jgi:GYF domain 2
MEWFYVHDGQKVGPVTDSQFMAWVQSGHITSETLVWRSGMQDWQAYGTINPSARPPSIGNNNKANSPIWRESDILVMTHSALLPDRCVKCNAVSQQRLKRKLSWHHPGVYLTIPLGVMIYVIVALMVRKTATIEIGLCDEHFKKRKRDMLIGWLIFLIGIGLIAGAFAIQSGWVGFSGVMCLLGALVYSVVTVSVITPKRIDEFVWLKGACPDYLATFPKGDKHL